MKSGVKRLFVLILIGILYFCFGLNQVEAKQLSTPLYFGINELRTLSSPNWGYAIGNPNSNGQGENAKGIKLWNILKYSSSTSNDPTEVDVYCVKSGVGFVNDTHRRASYNFAFDMYKERDEIAKRSTTLNGLVNGGHYNELLALANILYLAEDGTEDLEAYLAKAGITYDYNDELLTADQVKAVQQAAVWYFTNYGEENGKYDKTASNASGWLNYTTDGKSYTSLGDYQVQPNRLGYQLQMQAEQLYKYLINTAKANASNYSDPDKNYKTKLTLYTAQGANGEEQPLMEIEREKQFDLSLRKYITKVNGAEVSVSREPQIDLTNLKNESDTTAIYKHKKDPVLVQNGDTVTYKIQVYNEGDVDGYVNKIVDQLPTGLKFSRLITSGYTASYDSSNNVVTITRDESNNDRLTAFNGSNLDSTTLELECTVDTTEGDKVLTNVAWISEEETIDGNVITNEVGDDRDSEPETKPDVNKDNMEDYKGNDENQDDLADKDYFYKGQQDDDDFEKLITKKIEGSYNLQIVKIDKEDNSKLQGAEFKVTLPDGTERTETTNEDGIIDLGKVEITQTGTDTIKIEELNAPSGYNKLFNSFELDVTKEEKNGAYVATNVDLKNSQGSGLGTGQIQVNNQNGIITITVPNEKTKGSYDLQIVKVDKSNPETKLEGAQFKITLPDGSNRTETTDVDGTITIEGINIEETGTDTIKVEEISAPKGYNKLFNSFELDVTKEEKNGAYVVTDIDLKNSEGSGLGTGEIKSNYEDGLITITVPNEKIEGSYDLQLVKVDKDNPETKLEGAQFKITLPDGSEKTETTDGNGTITIQGIKIEEAGTDTIKVEEITAPSGYNKLFNSFELDVTKEEQNGSYVVTNVNLKNSQESGLGTGQIQTSYQNKLVTITVPNGKIEGSYDLQLVKVDKDNEATRLEGAQFKITLPDGSERTETTDGNGTITIQGIKIEKAGTDTIKVEEITAPSGYNKLFNSFELDVTKGERNGAYVVTNINLKNSQGSGLGSGQLQSSYQDGTIIITVPNEKTEGSYNLQLVKVDKDNEETRLEGAQFKITLPDGSEKTETTDSNGTITIDGINITEPGTDTIKVEEIKEPSGYNKLFNSFELDVTKEEKSGAYVITNIDLKNSQGSGLGEGRIHANYQDNLVTITVPNEKIEGSYNLQLEKVDSEDDSIKLQGAEFSVTLPGESPETKTTDENGIIDLGQVEITEVGTKDTITIEETKAPDEYDKITGTITVEVEKQENNGEYSIKNASVTSGEGASVTIDGNTIHILVKDNKTKYFDLSLRKFIVAVSSDENVEDGEYLKNRDGSYTREPVVDTSLLNTVDGSGKKIITAIYKHTKEPVTVKRNDYVVYILRVYNEGDIAGYAAEIKDHLPPYLEFVDGEFNKQYGWEVSEDGRTVTTRYLENSLLKAAEEGENGYTLSYADVPIMCRVTDSAIAGENITNIADITEYQDEDKQPVEDRDSEEDNVKLPEDKDLPNYKDEESGDYIPGQEDDDDFEKVVVEEDKYFDLSLRKFIVAVSSDENIEDGEYLKDSDGSYAREPVVDTSLLNTTDGSGSKITTAIYNRTKEPVTVRRNDYVVYMLRVYNEGDIAGYAAEIKDHLPPYLEFVDNSFNQQYGWQVSEDGRLVTTNYLNNNLLNAAEKTENGYTLSYADVPIMCKVVDGAVAGENITNIADITEYQDEEKKPVEDRDSEEDNVKLPEDKDLPNYKDEETGEYVPGQEDDDDFEKVVVEEDKYFDLSLRKFIIAVSSDENVEDGEYLRNQDGSYTREPVVDTSLLNTTDGSGSKITTAIYNHTKESVTVKRNDYVVYMLRVYNEGDIAGYAAEIKDHLPPYLEFVDNSFNQGYGWEVSEDGRTVTTRYLENSLLKAAEEGENGYTLSYADVPIMCRVTDSAIAGENITNIADITEYQDEDKQPVEDRDSEEDNVKLPEDKDLPNYKDEETGDYIPGQEDDDDFEKVIVEEDKYFDLSLRKFIIAVSSDENIEDGEYLKDSDGSYTREPVVDTSLLNTIGSNGSKITTAIYNHTKEPVTVRRNDYVVYMLRVYNEGDIAGYAAEIKDHLPPYLEFVDGEFNKQYGWEVSEDGRTVTTRYLENSLLKAAEEGESGYTLSYADVPIMCRVTDSAIAGENITNIADITEYQDEEKKPVEDRDSEEDNVKLPEDKDLPGYKDEETGEYVPGQEDDDDFEKVIVEEDRHFDLALRKFITKVDDKNITDRIPEVSYDKGTDKITYNHTKDPVLVVNGNIVTYTIRVYNEGDINGYANVISDDIPEGLEFLPNNETNINYRWVMYDANGNVTENVNDAVSIRTDYLSKEQEENSGDNLLLAFNPDEEISQTNPSYKDVQVAFRVIEPNESDRILVNSAQISDDSDEDGNEVEDEDSTPDEWNEGEDDQDREYVKLVYFDLSLRKWVTQAIVIDENGQKVTETGHQPYDDPEQIVKVELYRKNVNDVTVKFRYKIRVTNEGEIAGYAKEITDYVPDGLRFLPEDNPGWTDEGNNVISTRLLENTLLQPGEYAEVEVVLTWINSTDNMGEKVNTAEISEDYNDYGVPDKDSTPDNQKRGEDDIDDAPVLLSVSTGQVRIYFTLGFVVLVTIASGLVLIKKFVL